nr:amidohydrolase [Alteromonas ponticola]
MSGFTGKVNQTDGALIVPGLIDNHTHFMTGVEGLVSVSTLGATSKEDFVNRIASHVTKINEGEWITGGKWDETNWGGTQPNRHWVDNVTKDHPLLLMRVDSHSALVNSKALALAGIDDKTPDPVGGKIVRDKDGVPTGVLKDAAMEAVFKVMPKTTQDEEDRLLAIGMKHALKHGLTQIHSIPNVLEDAGWREYNLFKRANKNGTQTLRAVIYVPLKDRQKLADIIAADGKGDSWLSWPGVKAMTDGSLGSRSAWLYHPYSDDPSNSGMPIQPIAKLESAIEEANNLGLQLAIHAIGDRANDAVLDIFSKLKPPPVRPRIEHAQHLSQDAVARFSALGAVASMQPYHAIDDGRWAEKRIGKQRLTGTYAFRSLKETGTRITFGSDWNVAPLDPIAGIYAAVTRRTLDGENPQGWIPGQKISVEDALTAYTINNAWAVGMEDQIGSIEVGKFADFVVLDQNLFNMAPEDIRNTKVLMTVIDGNIMYQSE